MLTTLIILIIIAIPVTWALSQNALVAGRERVNEGWSGITIQLKRRHALIPNLVQAAQTAMTHENSIFDKLLAARTEAVRLVSSGSRDEITEAEAHLTAALNDFVGYAEDTPEITANGNIQLLQTQLEETEDQIAAARRLYNGNVTAYNMRLDQIPYSYVAARGGFERAALFEVDEAEFRRISQDLSVSDLGLGAGT
ncbi:MAG: LemA family protein [Pseudomonadota bacterium]